MAVVDPRVLNPALFASNAFPGDVGLEPISSLELAMLSPEDKALIEADLAQRSGQIPSTGKLETPTGETRLSADIRAAAGAGVAPPALEQEKAQNGKNLGTLLDILKRVAAGPAGEGFRFAGQTGQEGAAQAQTPPQREAQAPDTGVSAGDSYFFGSQEEGGFIGRGASPEEARANFEVRKSAGVSGTEGIVEPGRAFGVNSAIAGDVQGILAGEGGAPFSSFELTSEDQRIAAERQPIFADAQTEKLSAFVDEKLKTFEPFSQDNYNKFTRTFRDDPKEMAVFNQGWIRMQEQREAEAGGTRDEFMKLRFKLDFGTTAGEIDKQETSLTPLQKLQNTDLTRTEKTLTELRKQLKDMRNPAEGTARFAEKERVLAQITETQRRADDLRIKLNIAQTTAEVNLGDRSMTEAGSFISQNE